MRIVRTLKGKYGKTHVRIGSGPIESCSPTEVHYRFVVGSLSIFILPCYPTKGETRLVWGGSLLSTADTELVESRIDRGRVHRAGYLERLQQSRPQVHAAAVELAARMRNEAKTWPAFEWNPETHSPSKTFTAAVDDLVQRLKKIDCEAIRGAVAVDWLRDDPQPWWERDAWREALVKLTKSRKAEIVRIEKARIAEVLADAGVEKKWIDRYLAAVEPGALDTSLQFPPRPPYYRSQGEREKSAVPIDEELTTDFLLRYHSYDRGAMFPAYAAGFNSTVLRGLNAGRVKPIIASLLRSPDERLRWLAGRVIALVPGTEFVDLVLDDMMEEERVSEWEVLADYDNPEQLPRRLAALIDEGAQRFTPWGVAAMWNALRRGECFEPVCIAEAIAALEIVERVPGVAGPDLYREKANDDTPYRRLAASDDRPRIAYALQNYLAAARARTQGAEHPKLSAAEYRWWFKDWQSKQSEKKQPHE